MNRDERRKSIGLWNLILGIVGVLFVGLLLFAFVNGMFEETSYEPLALFVTVIVYAVVVIVLLHRSLAEAFGELVWAKVVWVQRCRLNPFFDDRGTQVKGLKMKVDINGSVYTFRYTKSFYSGHAEENSVGHYVAVYKLGPFMSIDVGRRRELEENEYTR